MHLVLTVLCMMFCGLSAFEVGTEVNFSNGYRYDELGRTNTLKSKSVSQKDHIDANINLYQVGLNGRFVPKCYNFFLNGFAYWGWGGGHLHEHIKGLSEAQAGRAWLKNARTEDYQIGAGYLFDCNCWNLGISGGYAYDRQIIKSKNGQIAFPSSARFKEAAIYGKGYKTITTWQGPWVGTELLYNWRIWRLSLGYEFHFAHYHANHTIPHDATSQQEGMASSTRSRRAYGNVVFLNGRYFFCKGWEIGLIFKYQNWQAHHGRLTSSYFANNGLTADASATGKWISYSLIFDIGYAL